MLIRYRNQGLNYITFPLQSIEELIKKERDFDTYEREIVSF